MHWIFLATLVLQNAKRCAVASLWLVLGATHAPAQVNDNDTQYAIIAHPDCGVSALSLPEAVRIFRREAKSWHGKKSVPIKLVLPAASSESMQFALKKIYKTNQHGLKKYWVEMIYQHRISVRPKHLSSQKLLVRMVEKMPGTTSIIRYSDLPKDAEVVVLKIDGKAPGQTGYSLSSGAKESVGRSHWIRRITGRLAFAEPSQTEAREAASPRRDDDADRMDELENALLDLQMEVTTGGSGADLFENGPNLALKGFGHVTFSEEKSEIADDETAFALGGLDLFITSQLSDKLSFMNETVFEPTDAGEYVLDVERVILKYEVNDHVNISAGRFHTSLGHWNGAFHHGEWLSNSIGRPAILNFEDEDGLLPIHLIGLALNGWFEVGDSALLWAFEVGNGRGVTPDPPQNTIDANKSKAINLNVGFKPAALPGLKLGAGAFIDKIPAATTLDEVILSGYAVYDQGPLQVMAEYYDIEHEDNAGVTATSQGYYGQVSYRLAEWTPYVRYDVTDIDDQDTFFASTDDTRTIAGGVRYDFTDWSALKLQYDTTQISPTGGGSDLDRSSLALQLSFTF